MRIATTLALLMSLSVSANAADYFGKVDAVADGDTFSMQSGSQRLRVRLCGVDSPERGQPGYGAAAGALSALIEGKSVHCLQVGEGTPCDSRSKSTSRDRVVAQCFIGAKDVAMEMICANVAVDLPRFSGGYYQKCSQ